MLANGEQSRLLAGQRRQLTANDGIHTWEHDLQSTSVHPVGDDAPCAATLEQLLVRNDRPLDAGQGRHRCIPRAIHLGHDRTLAATRWPIVRS
jgi:hypothetical protein